MPEPTKTSRVSSLTVAMVMIGLLVPMTAESHDYWLVQEPSTLEAGDRCRIRLLVGDRLDPELERPLQLDITTRYEWLTASGSENLLESLPEGTEPVFERTVARDETALLVMDRDFVDIETTYGQFREFLEHEEATSIAEQVESVPPDSKMRRRYARNLKALVRVGAGDDARLHSRRVGQKLEILLPEDPWTVRQGDRLNVQILFDEKPIAGLLVKRFVGDPEGLVVEQRARTDENGLVSFPFERAGLWVLRVTYLRPCPNCEGPVWDTYYATFSLQVPAVSGNTE